MKPGFKAEGTTKEVLDALYTICLALLITVIYAFFVVVIYYLLRWPIELATTRIHWVVGLFYGVSWMVGSIAYLIIAHRRVQHGKPDWDLFGVLVLASLVAGVISFAWTSWMLQVHELGYYKVQTTVALGFEPFVDLYIYEILELIPGLKLTETLLIPAPIQPIDRTAGIPIVLFRLYLIVGILATIKSIWDRFTKAIPTPMAEGNQGDGKD
jgi:hypothetical protein